MTLDLNDEETAALFAELDHIIDGDRYPFSSRIRTLTAIRDKIRPPPASEPLPPLRSYAPPRACPERYQWFTTRPKAIKLIPQMKHKLTLIAVAICFASLASAAPKTKTPGELLMECIKNVAKARPGMTAAEVLTVVCRPDHINSTVTLNGKREQWVYPDVFETGRGAQYLYFEDGRVTAVQSHN